MWPFLPDLSGFLSFFIPFQCAPLTRSSFHCNMSASLFRMYGSTRQAWSIKIPCRASIFISLHCSILKRFLGPSLLSMSSKPSVIFLSQAQLKWIPQLLLWACNEVFKPRLYIPAENALWSRNALSHRSVSATLLT